MAILRRQRKQNDCGPTCFANTLNILGYDITIAQANKICGLGPSGTDSIDLTKAFNKFGFETKEREYRKEDKAWNWLKRDTNKGIPIILAVDEDSHWILVLRAGDNEAQIFDPLSFGPEKILKKDLMDRWDCSSGIKSKFFMGLMIKPIKKKAITAIALRKKILNTIDVS